MHKVLQIFGYSVICSPILGLLASITVFTSSAADQREQPLVNSSWSFSDRIAGGSACVARRAGPEVDTMLMLNRHAELLLVIGRQDWQRPGGNEEIAIEVDGYRIDHLQASQFNNLVFLLIPDGSVVQRLRDAKAVDWFLGSGRFHASVDGLAGALDWVQSCERAKKLPPG